MKNIGRNLSAVMADPQGNPKYIEEGGHHV